jgi:hypothetical protein
MMASDQRRQADDSTRRLVVLDLRRKLEYLADYLNLGRTVTALADGLNIPRRTIADAVREGGCTRRLHHELREGMRLRAVKFDPDWPEWRERMGYLDRNANKAILLHRADTDRADTFEKFVGRFARENNSGTANQRDVVITIDVSYTSFSEEEQRMFLQSLDGLLKTGRTLHIRGKEPGSVKLTVSLTLEEFHRLGKLLIEGELEELKVRRLDSSYGSYQRVPDLRVSADTDRAPAPGLKSELARLSEKHRQLEAKIRGELNKTHDPSTVPGKNPDGAHGSRSPKNGQKN